MHVTNQCHMKKSGKGLVHFGPILILQSHWLTMVSLCGRLSHPRKHKRHITPFALHQIALDSSLSSEIRLSIQRSIRNAGKGCCCQRPEEGCRCQGSQSRRGEEEEEKDQEGDLFCLHLQGAEAGAPRDRHLQQGHEHHELLRKRHLREDCR